jgi:hypothetical protein
MAKRGKKKMDPAEKRLVRVTSFFSTDELAALDAARCTRSRAEHIRMCIRNAVPAPVPSLNVETASNLGRALGNLASLAAASRRGGFVQERDLLPVLIDLRNLLLTGKTQLLNSGDDNSGDDA